jgi:TonB family protein
MSDSPQLEGDDSLAHQSNPSEPITEPEDRDAGLYLAHLASTLAAHGGGSHSADLALDLVLNEIVEQARLASTATAASIALISDGELICRATTGANAPGLGVRIFMHSGLVAACFKSREPERCDDAEIDPRVDAEAYRNLEIRSILMVPVLNGDQILGIFQIFSPRANEFGDREEQTLQALSRRIVNNVRFAADNQPPPIQEFIAPVPDLPFEPEPQAGSPVPTFTKILATAGSGTDFWTSALTGLVIGLALLLGWMAGRDGEKAQPLTPSAAMPIPMPTRSGQPPKVQASKSKQGNPPPSSKPSAPGKNAEGISNAGLIVYDKGKVIYPAAAPNASPSKPGSTEGIEMLPPERVAALVKNQVEPEYPEAAKNAGVQGDVLMRVIVNQDGAVRDVQVEDGSPQLAPAAVDAVRQWRFNPYQVNGASHEFQARLVVHFRLPK